MHAFPLQHMQRCPEFAIVSHVTQSCMKQAVAIPNQHTVTDSCLLPRPTQQQAVWHYVCCDAFDGRYIDADPLVLFVQMC